MIGLSGNGAIEQVVRDNFGRLLAALTSRFSDLSIAEDCLQDAIETAVVVWQKEGMPANPAGWLMTVAGRKAIDQLRRENSGRDKVAQLLDGWEEADPEQMESIPDHRLQMIFTCCHPAIDEEARTALVLRNICGLTTRQIARAWMSAESTMAQRLVRAKSKITKTAIAYEVPDFEHLPARLDSVLRVIYLIFNEGYQSSDGDELIDINLYDEAIYLGKLLVTLMPDETEATGLLCLMLFHDSRRGARTGTNGELIDLEQQNRSYWDYQKIAQADKMLKATLMRGKPGKYQIQAAISAVHCHSQSWSTTDWKQIALLYYRLADYDPNPVVQVNLAVALSFSENADTALAFLDNIARLDQLKNYHPYHIARADMLFRSGRVSESITFYQQAVTLTDNRAEQEYLGAKIEQLSRMLQRDRS